MKWWRRRVLACRCCMPTYQRSFRPGERRSKRAGSSRVRGEQGCFCVHPEPMSRTVYIMGMWGRGLLKQDCRRSGADRWRPPLPGLRLPSLLAFLVDCTILDQALECSYASHGSGERRSVLKGLLVRRMPRCLARDRSDLEVVQGTAAVSIEHIASDRVLGVIELAGARERRRVAGSGRASCGGRTISSDGQCRVATSGAESPAYVLA